MGSRTLLGVCIALAVLLGALAAVQYRWSTRVAAADVQREREHLDSAASLFATGFNNVAAQAARFLQDDAQAALRSQKPLTGLPKLIAEIYLLEPPGVRRLDGNGLFAAAPLPPWLSAPRCIPPLLEHPPALVTPIYEIGSSETHSPGGEARILKTFRLRTGRCLVARLDESWVRSSLIPQLLRRSFGETSIRDYDFAVVSRSRPQEALYGTPARADVRKPFFSISGPLPSLPLPPSEGRHAVIIQQRVETVGENRFFDLHGPGMWELQVSRKGMPLAAAFEQTRRRDLLASIGVELMLACAVAFLVVGMRRMQRLADQKMRFVAGVSHEIRTPVSAISMLSRNQADGLVTGADKVRQYGELIHQQTRRLNEMLEQSLQYAGIHSGLRRPTKSQVDLRELITAAIEERRRDLAGFEVEMELGELPPIQGDAKLLRTAFDNLLDNALKHAGGGRWVRVAAMHCAPEKELRVSVEDRGDGIDAEDQAGIFEPFARGRAAVDAQIPGSGLGLSLVRSAAEAHRGAVTVSSAPGRGSTFTLHLPL
jgi:signal transduction histidine kinase